MKSQFGRQIVCGGRLAESLVDSFLDLGFDVRIDGEFDDLDWGDTFIDFNPPTCKYENLQWVHSCGAGVDNFLTWWSQNPSVLLTRTVGEMGLRIGQYCLARILFWCERMPEAIKSQSRREWREMDSVRALADMKVLLLGCGSMGKCIMKVLNNAGCSTFAVARQDKSDIKNILKLEEVHLVAKSFNVIIVALPLTKKTKNFLNFKFLSMFSEALLINVSRGEILDNEGLIKGMQNGHIDAAMLDVFEVEPLPRESLFWEMDRLWITPHIAARTLKSEVISDFLKCWSSLSKGETPTLAVSNEEKY